MGCGSSTQRGGGRKVRALPRKFVFLGFRKEESGMSQEFRRGVPDPGGVQKVRAKSSCTFCRSLKTGLFSFRRSPPQMALTGLNLKSK